MPSLRSHLRRRRGLLALTLALALLLALWPALSALAARPPGRPPRPGPPAGPVIPTEPGLTPEVEAAIERGLKFLQQAQNPDGSWSNMMKTSDGSKNTDNTVAMTALSLLAFMIEGHFPGEKPYGEAMAKGLDYLLKESKASPNGYMGTDMYNHGLATLALSELWGMTERDEEVRDALKAGVDVILRSQSRLGGWRYDPVPSSADISVTVMQTVALASARQAGILVPDETVDHAIRFVRMCKEESTGGFRYMPGDGAPGFARTGAALVSLQMCGQHLAPEVKSGLKYLDDLPKEKRVGEISWAYGMYYVTLATYMAGDQQFAKWYSPSRNVLLSRQAKDGSWSDMNSRPYGTALAVIVLGVPYAFVPAYQR